MAWQYYVGVTGMDHDHFIAGPTTADRTNINELVPKVVRRIYRVGQRPFGQAANYADFLLANDKLLLPTLFDNNEWHASQGGQPALNGPDGSPGHTLFLNCCNDFAAALSGKVEAVELVNELGGGGGQYAVDHAVGAIYWDRFREASVIFRNAGIEILLSGPPTGQNKDVAMIASAGAEAIFPFCDGFVLHPYSTNAGSAASPLSTSNPGPGTQLGWTWARRQQVDAFGATAASKHMWITEFGWVTKNPAGTPFNLTVNEATLAARITSSYQNWETHAEELKLRCACWFSWSDWNVAGTGQTSTHPFRYSGIRTNEVPPYQTGPNGGNVADWDYRVGVQVAQDADTLKPTLAGTLPAGLSGTASGLLEHAPGSTIRYAQGIPVTAPLASGSGHYANDALYMADVLAARKRPLVCLGVGRDGTWRPTWTSTEWGYLIQRWVSVLYAAGVRDFEVGNEIENPVEPYLTDYFDLLDIASPIIRANAGTNVILTSTLGPGTDQLDFLEEVTARGKWGLCDAAALHPYGTAGGVATKITDARAAGRIPAAKDIYITEMGIGSDNGGSGFTTTEAGQATFLTSVFNSLTKTFIEANRIRLTCLFVYANYLTAGDTTGNWDNYSGLRRANGNYKPAWDSAIAAGYGKGLAVPWYYKNGGGRSAIAVTTGRNLTAKEALDAFGEGTVGTGSAPVSVTGVADQVTQTTARLKGTVDPNSLPTSWFYEYSTEPLP